MRNVECGMRNGGAAIVRQIDLRDRTRTFALAIIRLVEELPRSRTADVIGKQLLRAGTSVAANYRAACRARSRREFIAKMGIVEEEADESQFWLEMIAESRVAAAERLTALQREAGQLVAISVSSIRTAREGRRTIPHSAFRIPH
jgi:four helix bundle protein